MIQRNVVFQTERKRWFCSPALWNDGLPIRDLMEIRRHEISESFTEAFSKEALKTLPDPSTMLGLERAAQRVCNALLSNEKLTIFGDYDVDGTVSCALLSRFLGEYGFQPEVYIPNRMTEGYGLNSLSVQQVSENGTKVIVTVDNGIAAVEACDLAKSLGIDVIVTDHHEPPAVLPEAFAIVNPKQPGCSFPYKALAGVGVAFYLAIALRRLLTQNMPQIKPNLRSYLDLVAIGTIADMCPLNGLNHLLTRVGLQSLATNLKLGHRPGIESLAEIAGIEATTEISSEHIGYQIGPRLNAAGRLGTALKTAELLSTNDKHKANALAKELDAENKERRILEKQTFSEVQFLVAQAMQSAENRRHSVVLFKKNWHPGVLGIVASRCVEKYYKPSLILTEAEGIIKGSGRSTEEINLFELLDKHRKHFLSFGGHPKAVGLSIASDKLEWLKETLENEVRDHFANLLQTTQINNSAARPIEQSISLNPPLAIDTVLGIEEITESLNAELSSLEPFGFGNSRPKFAIKNVVVTHCRAIGQNHADGHCQVEFASASKVNETSQATQRAPLSKTLKLTAFSLREALEKALEQKTLLHIAIEVSEGYWKGRKKLELRLCDFGVAKID